MFPILQLNPLSLRTLLRILPLSTSKASPSFTFLRHLCQNAALLPTFPFCNDIFHSDSPTHYPQKEKTFHLHLLIKFLQHPNLLLLASSVTQNSTSALLRILVDSRQLSCVRVVLLRKHTECVFFLGDCRIEKLLLVLVRQRLAPPRAYDERVLISNPRFYFALQLETVSWTNTFLASIHSSSFLSSSLFCISIIHVLPTVYIIINKSSAVTYMQ